MADIPVCKDNWNGVKNETFTWNNNTGEDVTISPNGNATFPFVPDPGSNLIVVPAHSKKSGQLIGQASPTPYTYNSNPCPQLGNPKNVIIT